MYDIETCNTHASFDVHYIIHAVRKYVHPDESNGYLPHTQRHRSLDPKYLEQEPNQTEQECRTDKGIESIMPRTSRHGKS